MTHNEYIKNIPSLPITSDKAMKLRDCFRCDPWELKYLISLDPVLTGRVLKNFNRIYEPHNLHITSLAGIIIKLNIDTVKYLALSAVTSQAPSANMDAFWRRSLSVGITSKLLAKERSEEYYIAGLLHDVGKLDENSRLDHCAAGRLIAEDWGIKGPIADVIAYHHNLDAYHGDNAAILYTVAIADYFCAEDEQLKKPPQKIWDAAGIKDDAFEKLKDTVKSEIEKAKSFLKV